MVASCRWNGRMLDEPGALWEHQRQRQFVERYSTVKGIRDP
jgi:hypothetical protein